MLKIRPIFANPILVKTSDGLDQISIALEILLVIYVYFGDYI
jgi:hypothetical protein